MATFNSLQAYITAIHNGTLDFFAAKILAEYVKPNQGFTYKEMVALLDAKGLKYRGQEVSSMMTTMAKNLILIKGPTVNCSVTGNPATQFLLNPNNPLKIDILKNHRAYAVEALRNAQVAIEELDKEIINTDPTEIAKFKTKNKRKAE